MCASWAATVTPARYHGTLSGYTHHGCRCGDCTRARQNYDRVYKSGDLGLLNSSGAGTVGVLGASGRDRMGSRSPAPHSVNDRLQSRPVEGNAAGARRSTV